MKDDYDVAGEVMAAVMGMTNEDGQSIAERMSVADLWLVIQETVKSVRLADATGMASTRLAARSLNPDETKVYTSAAVHTAIKNGQKIVAIKEARALTGMSLKESKELVEEMERWLKGS